MKLIIFLLLWSFLSVSTVFAQTVIDIKSNPWSTKVGNPTEQDPTGCPAGGTGCGLPPPQVADADLKKAIFDLANLELIDQGVVVWKTTHLRWLYEFLWSAKKTSKFVDLVSTNSSPLHHKIYACNCTPNQEKHYIEMSQEGKYAGREEFLATLTHELGHAIDHGQPSSKSFDEAHNRVYLQTSELSLFLSTYSRSQYDVSENYAEVIAYCMNKKAVGSINENIWKQYYLNLAEKILGNCIK